MPDPRTTAGIDVSKDHLDLATYPPGDPVRVPNTPDGCAALADRLVALEATGGYEAAAVAALHLAGVPVAVVNPARPGTSPASSAATPRPTGSMPPSSPSSPPASTRPRRPPRTRTARRWRPS